VFPADPVVIVYTSGSTGDPKGVVHSHGAVVRHSFNLTFTYVTTADDVLFTSMPFFWIGGLITGLLAVIHHGATIVTQPAFDAGEALELMERERATIAQGWPQQGTSLLEHPRHGTTDLSSIRRTSMPDFVPAEARPPAISSMALGMTEACSCHTNFDPYVPLDESKRGTFGPSIEGLEHKIIDPGTGQELPSGQEGEICVRGYSMMLGRHKVERQDTFDADGWYHTGDAGWLNDEGWLFFVGRLGDLIKTSGGANVTPAEVEAGITAVPDVLEAYVVGVTDPTGTAGTQVVTAAVVPVAGATIDPQLLRSELKESMSAFKIPKVVWVCDKAELPFTDTGKIKKADLAELLARRLEG
jgi:acyl-CoA synthetase (AMP-forming)/AMP-acid ligase II